MWHGSCHLVHRASQINDPNYLGLSPSSSGFYSSGVLSYPNQQFRRQTPTGDLLDLTVSRLWKSTISITSEPLTCATINVHLSAFAMVNQRVPQQIYDWDLISPTHRSMILVQSWGSIVINTCSCPHSRLVFNILWRMVEIRRPIDLMVKIYGEDPKASTPNGATLVPSTHQKSTCTPFRTSWLPSWHPRHHVVTLPSCL